MHFAFCLSNTNDQAHFGSIGNAPCIFISFFKFTYFNNIFYDIAPSADDSRSVVQLGSVVSQSSERLLWKHFEVARVTS